ncbi:MAG: hypothetical protein ACREAF_00170 [Nitrosopumilaceae archaeon]
METISQKTVSIEFEGKEYVLQNDVTLSDFLSNLGLPSNKTMILQSKKDGFVLSIK